MLQDAFLDFVGNVVGEIRGLQISIERQRAVQHLDRTGHRGYGLRRIEVGQQLPEVIQRLDRIGRLIVENEMPVG
jgi:hypothetical protein